MGEPQQGSGLGLGTHITHIEQHSVAE